MTASASSSTAVLVAGSALLAAAGLRYWAGAAHSNTNNKLLPDDITSPEVCEIYYRLLTDLQWIYQDLVRQIQLRLCDLSAAGHDIPTNHKLLSESEALLRSELETAKSTKLSALLAEFDIDNDCLEAAVADFLAEGNCEVRRAVTTFRTFWESTRSSCLWNTPNTPAV